jgi:hypothetical protein
VVYRRWHGGCAEAVVLYTAGYQGAAMKQARTENPKKQYPVNPQARPDYLEDVEERKTGQDAQTREDIERAEQEGMVKNKEGNKEGKHTESSDKNPTRRQQGASTRTN